MTNPWDQLPAESQSAYTAFLLYLHQGPTRTLKDAWTKHRQLKGKTVPHTSPPGSWTSWMTTHNWKNRAEDFDQHLLTERANHHHQEARERDQQNADTEWTLGTALLDKARELLRLPTTRQTITREQTDDTGRVVTQHITIEPINFRLGDSVRLAEMGSRLQRRSTGKPLDRSNPEDTAPTDDRPWGIDVILPDGTRSDDDDLDLPN